MIASTVRVSLRIGLFFALLLAAAPSAFGQAPPAPSSKSEVSLREYLESRTESEKEIAAVYREMAEVALKLQAAEYQRFNDSLRNDADQLRELQKNYATRESVDTFSRETSRRLEEITLRLTASESAAAARGRVLTAVVAVVGLLVTLLTVGSRFLMPRRAPLPPPAEPGMKVNGLK